MRRTRPGGARTLRAVPRTARAVEELADAGTGDASRRGDHAIIFARAGAQGRGGAGGGTEGKDSDFGNTLTSLSRATAITPSAWALRARGHTPSQRRTLTISCPNGL